MAKKISAEARRELVQAIGERYRAGSRQKKARIRRSSQRSPGFIESIRFES